MTVTGNKSTLIEAQTHSECIEVEKEGSRIYETVFLDHVPLFILVGALSKFNINLEQFELFRAISLGPLAMSLAVKDHSRRYALVMQMVMNVQSHASPCSPDFVMQRRQFGRCSIG